ncbi:MAG: cell surface lipoprotein [Methanosarcinaceae archaeon]|nr:cell surface lipoprotein [Methanosarcinaceae archaeon]
MNTKWRILIILLMLTGILLSGCADNAEEAGPEEETEETPAYDDVSEYGPVTEGKDYGVIMEYYGMMKPSEIELNRGDTVAWRNGKPQGTYVLISDDGLFEDQEMDHNDMYSYTFTESGTFNFSVRDVPGMTLTVTVR